MGWSFFNWFVLFSAVVTNNLVVRRSGHCCEEMFLKVDNGFACTVHMWHSFLPRSAASYILRNVVKVWAKTKKTWGEPTWMQIIQDSLKKKSALQMFIRRKMFVEMLMANTIFISLTGAQQSAFKSAPGEMCAAFCYLAVNSVILKCTSGFPWAANCYFDM